MSSVKHEASDAPITTDESPDAGAAAPAADEVRQPRWPKALAGGAAAVILVAGAAAFFLVDVCEEQLSGDGDAVRVCRHLDAADPPVVAAGLALVVLLSAFFTEISGFGLTLKREVAELKKEVGETRAQQGRDHERVSDASQHAAEVGSQVVALRNEVAPEPSVERVDPVRALADEYNEIRLTMPSGTPRTTEMTRIFTQLIGAVRSIDDFDVLTRLQSDDRGLRLSAYAYLYSRPDPRWAAALASAIIDVEDKPFGQYWGLRALRRLCEADPSAIDANTRRRLEAQLRPELPVGSDRLRELTAVLTRCS